VLVGAPPGPAVSVLATIVVAVVVTVEVVVAVVVVLVVVVLLDAENGQQSSLLPMQPTIGT
jgi:hypothetical protein